MGRRGREAESQKNTYLVWQSTGGKDPVDPELSPKEREVQAPCWSPQHGEKAPPKHLALETNRPYVWELWELWGAKILLLRDVCSLTNPGTWYKGNSLRSVWTICEADSLVSLKHLPVGQG